MEQETVDRIYSMVDEGKGFPDIAQELQLDVSIVRKCYIKEYSVKHRPVKRRVGYYVVGATWGDNLEREDKFSDFIKNGYWKMGWDEASTPIHFAERLHSIRVGDYIAIKRLMGRDSIWIKIKAIGKVIGIVNDIILVHWIECFEDRIVPIKGCIGTIYGPFRKDEKNGEWLEKVFSL